MNEGINNYSPQLFMRKKELLTLPSIEVPKGYTLRHFIPGDEVAWERIIEDSFNWKTSFEDTIRNDKYFQEENVLFICYDNIPIATATAKYNPEYGDNTGYVHMVGVHSLQKGKGLGFLISLAVLHRMFEEGRQEAVLETDDFRIPAIKTYLKLGFILEIIHENQEQRWNDIFQKLRVSK